MEGYLDIQFLRTIRQLHRLLACCAHHTLAMHGMSAHLKLQIHQALQQLEQQYFVLLLAKLLLILKAHIHTCSRYELNTEKQHLDD